MANTRSVVPRNRRGGTTVLLAVLVGLALLAVGFGVAPATAQEDKEVVAEFEAIGQEGFVEINSQELEEPIQFPTPEEVDQPIAVDGEIYADGTWRAPEENVSFPTLSVFGGIEVQLEAVEDFTGTIDREAGTMTLDGNLEITVSGESIGVTANLTTETSNNLEGSAEGLDTDSANVTLVDNEFTIPDTTGTIADSAIGLPSTEPGTNWFSLTLDAEITDVEGPGETGGTVSGVVTGDGPTPVEGATVSAAGSETTTDASGTYQLQVPAGTQTVTVDADGFESSTGTVEVQTGGTATLDVTLDSLETGTVSGTVTDGAGDPVEGATVSAAGTETTTDASGAYELQVPGGAQDVMVEADGFESATESVEVVAGSTTTLEVELTRVATVSGTVTDESGNPVEGATVSAGDAEVTTDASGAYEIQVPGDTQELAVEGDGFESVTESLDVQAGGTATVDIELTSAGEPDFRADDVTVGDVDPGDTATVTANLTNVGDAPGEQEVTLSLGPVNESFTVSLGVNEQRSLELEWETTEEDGGQEYDARLVTADDSISTTVVVGEIELNIEDADFVAESTGGYITFDEDGYGAIEDAYGVDEIENHEDIRAAIEGEGSGTGPGLALPNVGQGEEPILIAGKIDEQNNSWTEVDSFFPVLEDENYPFDGFVETLEPFNGTFDREDEVITAESRFKVFVDGREDATFEFDVILTSEQSGDIPTNFAEFGEDTGTAHLVSNDFPVNDQTGDGIIDAELSLPSTEPSRNYIELGFNVDFDPDPADYGDAFDREDPGSQLGNTGGGGDDSGTDTIVLAGQGLGALGVVLLLAFVGGSLYARVDN